MPVVIGCSCGQVLRVPRRYVGQKVKCPGCGGGIRIAVECATPLDITPVEENSEEPVPTLVELPVDEGLLFDCSGCGKTMRARPEFAGKQTRCPACRSIVTIGATPAPDTVTMQRQADGYRQTPLQPFPAAFPTPSAPDPVNDVQETEEPARRPRGRRSRRTGGVPVWPFLLGGGVTLLVVAGGLLIFVFRAYSSAWVKDVDLIPADSMMIISLRPAAIRKTPACQQLVQNVPSLAQFLAKADADSTVFERTERATLVGEYDGTLLLLLATTVEIREVDFLDSIRRVNGGVLTKKQAGGKDYYLLTNGGFNVGRELGHCRYNERLMLIGEEGVLTKALHRGTNVSKQGPMADLIKKMSGTDMLIAGTAPPRAGMNTVVSALKENKIDLPLEALSDVKLVQLIGNIDQGINLEMTISLADSGAAKRLMRGLEESKRSFDIAFGFGKIGLGPQQQQAIADTMKSLAISSNDKDVKIRLAVDARRIVDALK